MGLLSKVLLTGLNCKGRHLFYSFPLSITLIKQSILRKYIHQRGNVLVIFFVIVGSKNKLNKTVGAETYSSDH